MVQSLRGKERCGASTKVEMEVQHAHGAYHYAAERKSHLIYDHYEVPFSQDGSCCCCQVLAALYALQKKKNNAQYATGRERGK